MIPFGLMINKVTAPQKSTIFGSYLRHILFCRETCHILQYLLAKLPGFAEILWMITFIFYGQKSFGSLAMHGLFMLSQHVLVPR